MTDPEWSFGPPCKTCGTWPEEFFVVEGRNDKGGSCSFGHRTSEVSARLQLEKLRPAHPEYTKWTIIKATPVVRIEHVLTEESRA